MTVRIEKDGHVWTVIHHRPEARNAMDPESSVALNDAFLAFERDDEARVAVFFDDGGAFCAGWDLKHAAAPDVDFPKEQIRHNPGNRRGHDDDNPRDARRRFTMRAKQHPDNEADLHEDVQQNKECGHARNMHHSLITNRLIACAPDQGHHKRWSRLAPLLVVAAMDDPRIWTIRAVIARTQLTIRSRNSSRFSFR